MSNDSPGGNDDAPPAPPNMGGMKPAQPDVINTTSSKGDNEGLNPVDLSEVDDGWVPYFRYDTAYGDQVDAIDTFLDILAGNGYFLLEGACGTGKTLAAASAAIHAIRDRKTLTKERITDDSENDKFPKYSRALVVTPLKQQLKQFVEEMRGINESLPSGHDAVTTVVMRGSADMMPYSYTDLQPFDDGGFRDNMEDLREMTAQVIRFGSDIPIDWPDGMSPPPHSHYDYEWDSATAVAEQHREKYRFDPVRAEAVRQIVSDLDSRGDMTYDRLSVNGVDTPYPAYVPHTSDIVDTNRLGSSQLPMDLRGKIDPFYAGFFAQPTLTFDFSDAKSQVFDQREIFAAAASRGACPHESMSYLAGKAEVVLGNYNHLFDPQTRFLTDEKIGLIDEETIVVVDEAHQIESRVRDMLSLDLDIYTLHRTISDVAIARQYAIGNFEKTPTPGLKPKDKSKAKEKVNQSLMTVGGMKVTVDDLAEVERFLNHVKQKLAEFGSQGLNEDFSNASWQKAIKYNWNISDIEYPLSNPKNNDMDSLMADILNDSEFDRGTFIKVYAVMLSLDFAYDALAEMGVHDRSPQGVEVGKFFKQWAEADNVEYHRHVLLEHSEKEKFPTEFPEWVGHWTPKFQLYNCVPRDELRGVFSEIGGGVLMSATIRPEEVFKEAVGIDDVPYPAEDEPETKGGPESSTDDTGSDDKNGGDDSEQATPEGARPSAFAQYPLRFPQKNRLSLTVDLPRFTNDNRGKTARSESDMTSTRKQYADMLYQTASMQGNILIVMPNYREAEWAYGYLRDRGVSKRLHLDQSSSSYETDEILNDFFEAGDAILFTSCRGTITEGVDYDGAKLHCCAVVGIPLLPTHQPHIQAIREAYDKRMTYASGFETALTVPAVRKVRQSFGRVIRGADEVGVRLLLDERYGQDNFFGVKEYLSDQEQEEFRVTDPENLNMAVSTFWESVNDRDDIDPDQLDSSNTSGESDDDESVESVDPADLMGETEDLLDGESLPEGADGETVPEADYDGGYSKIYFGDKANLSGWTSIRTTVAENQIVPLVHEHKMEDPADGEAVKLNFAKELSVSGWTDVKADIVHDVIEPLAEAALEPESNTQQPATGDGQNADAEEYSKLYFGSGSSLSAWTVIDRAAIEDEIMPLIREHKVDDLDDTDEEDTIKLSFAKELSMGGWVAVDADVVRDEIEPIAKENLRY